MYKDITPIEVKFLVYKVYLANKTDPDVLSFICSVPVYVHSD